MNFKIDEKIYNSARKLYSDKLHYHNFGHVIDILENAKLLLKQCDENNIEYDKELICHAILFHDAGYDQDHRKKGFSNKETYSAHLAENILLDSGCTKKHVQKVIQAILCTHCDGICCSNNEKIVRAADLYGLAAPYNHFKSKAIDLFKERELLSGEKISWDQYKEEAFNIISMFLKPRILLDIELFSYTNYIFHTKVYDNVSVLMKDNLE